MTEKERRPWFRRPAWWVVAALPVLVSVVAADYIVEYALAKVPLPAEVKLPSTSEVYDRDGELIATYRDEVTRFIIDTRRLPDHVWQAVVAVEDKGFFEHDGISIGGMVRAAWANLTTGAIVQGGSTISQQYVKTAVLEDSSRTIERKLKEAVLAIKLERKYSKREILNFYLNTVYFGRGAYGIEAAARTYFARPARKLTIAQAAYLAGVIPAPERYQERAAAIERREVVLAAMESEGYVTREERDRAAEAKLKLGPVPQLRPRRQDAAYFLEWLRKEYLYPRFGECLYRCGLKIYTTIDMDMQSAAEETIASVLDAPGDPPAALVSMTPDGQVRALVGGPHYTSIKKARGFNYATDGKRHAGSAFKPFTLLAAIDDGISPSSRFSGESPKRINDPACAGPDGIWEPENYGGSSYGTLDLNTATANSVNTVFAELVSEIGPVTVAELVENFGFTGRLADGAIEPVCSLALGTLDVSVLEMARSYAGLAGRGSLPEVRPIRWVEARSGRCLLGYDVPDRMKCKKEFDSSGEQVVDANSADVLTRTLTAVVAGGTATSAQIGRPVAGKTGTTQDNRDAWFAGYTPQLATVVWMGYPVEKGSDGKLGTSDDISPLMHYCGIPELCRPVHGIDVVGGTFPAEIWGTFMAAALEGLEVESFVEPAFEPSTVLNPLPPPAPEPEKKDKEDEKPEGWGERDKRGHEKGNDD
ncbi:MAG: transglycosylase domain-containing protein [Actinomycetota bacterium]|nr:transglycosylase domain-containing protein [Actinomycetota bacterium]